MTERDKFLSMLKQSKKFRVCIIDDDDSLEELIEQEIDCDVQHEPITTFNNRLKRRGNTDFLFDEYDLLFFDTTYEDAKTNTSALDILELLVSENPLLANISKVFIGNEFVSYTMKTEEDSKERQLYRRVQELPHIVYGNRKGTKLENMIKYIKSEGKRRGIDVPLVLPEGTCSREILDIIELYMKPITKNLRGQSDLSKALSNALLGIKPTSETERRILKEARTIANLFQYNYHIISQRNTALGVVYDRAKERIESNTLNDDEIEID